MESIIISPKTKAESKLITDLLQKMKIPSKVLSDEEKEDIGLSMLMKQADRTKKVSYETIMKTLKGS